MRQFATKQNQPAKLNSGHLARPAVATTEGKKAADVGVRRAPTLPIAFDFTKVPVHSKAPQVQPKLIINTPGDIYEQEADRVADQVMEAPRPVAPVQIERRPAFQHGPAPAASSAPVPPLVQEVLGSAGQPLDANRRAAMEPRFGHDFSGVRVHADAKAAAAASSIEARAFTSNRSIVFGAGEYAPRRDAGQRLLAHELTHVVQQATGPLHKDRVAEGGASERHADSAAQHPAALVPGGERILLQRQSIPQKSQTGTSASKGVAATKSKVSGLTWMEIIPDAVVKSGDKPQKEEVTSHKKAHGRLADYEAGTFSYHQESAKSAKEGTTADPHEIAVAGPLGAGVEQADVNKAVAEIKTARSKIQHRFMKSAPGETYSGYMATPQQDAGLVQEMAKKTPKGSAATEAKAHPDWKKGTEASESYAKWRATALPTSVTNAKDKKWLIYQKIVPWEGDTSTINAYDQANITWGTGFAASGHQVQELTQRVLDKSPQARNAFFSAGITVDANQQYVVVDVDKKWKLHGKDAELYIRTNDTLLSLMVNVAQGLLPQTGKGKGGYSAKNPRWGPLSFFDQIDLGESLPRRRSQNWQDAVDEMAAEKTQEPKQAVLDANFETLLAHALKGIPDAVVNAWGVDQAALAAHAIHARPGNFSWKAWANLTTPTIDDVAEHIYDKTVTEKKNKKGETVTNEKGEKEYNLAIFESIVPEPWRKTTEEKKKKEREEKAKKEKEEKEKKEKEKEGEVK